MIDAWMTQKPFNESPEKETEGSGSQQEARGERIEVKLGAAGLGSNADRACFSDVRAEYPA